jgi:putative proteasome-type protease
MFRAAQLVGAAIRSVYNSDGPALANQGVGFDIGMLLGGQIKGRSMRLFQIYSAGNFIEATTDTPFLQIGEHKYGKPILDRVLSHDTEIQEGIKLVLISMDSTLRSNLSVGLPIDLLIYKRDEVKVAMKRRLTEDDPNFRLIRERWSASLRDAYRALPTIEWKD